MSIPPGQPFGLIEAKTLREHPETTWFAMGYDLFSFNDGDAYRRILAAQSRFDRMEILAFIGIWCPDCQEHVPGLLRILDAVKFPPTRLRIYSLDRAKTYPGGEELIRRQAITRLPTFVFFEDGREIGRIIETPEAASPKVPGPSLLAHVSRILG